MTASAAPVPYATIVADPPWQMEAKAALYGSSSATVKMSGNRLAPGVSPNGGRTPLRQERGPLPYETMTVEQIAAMPVAALVAPHAHLYLWTINSYLREAYDIASAWGFEVSIPLVWCKKPRGWLPGGTFFPTCEFILFGRRGSLAAKRRVRHQWFQWPRGIHSRKPQPFFALVEEVSPGPRLELFARLHRPGWECWGNQVSTFDENVLAVLGKPDPVWGTGGKESIIP